MACNYSIKFACDTNSIAKKLQVFVYAFVRGRILLLSTKEPQQNTAEPNDFRSIELDVAIGPE
jgi:hypothetical protein